MKPYSPEYGHALGKKIMAWCELSGITPNPADDAPNTYPALRQWWIDSRVRLTAFPVFSGNSDTSIYGSPEALFAFRAMHDYLHLVYRYEFDLLGEMKTARKQEARLGCLSAEEQLVFRIDTIGQSLYHFLSGGNYVEEQQHFCAWVYREVQFLKANRDPALGENDMQHLQNAVFNYYHAHQ